jgi:oxygen-independent coproporphyrinogen III oxidase
MTALGAPYQGYAYAYPHKTAYRPLAPARPLADVWSSEDRTRLFLYFHVPFCEARCGYCNLFTTARPPPSVRRGYLEALRREARAVRAALGPDARFAQAAVGGGTPTCLEQHELAQLLDVAARELGADFTTLPVSVETSPATADGERLGVLRERGVSRVSIGIQSMFESELAAAGRLQRPREAEKALDRIRDLGFPTLNVDLIYGLPGQTPQTFTFSIERLLMRLPEEFYLYPLYVRPLTGLSRHASSRRPADDRRLECYRAGRDMLRANGYDQVSMRLFRRAAASPASPDEYCCQNDGMIGLGCGARSYTRELHYSTQYGVAATSVRQILGAYLGQPDEGFSRAAWGIALDRSEQQRRWVIKSLLRLPGVSVPDYRSRFGSDPRADICDLARLSRRGFLEEAGDHLRLTAVGLERSDEVGPGLYSEAVRARMQAWEFR